MVYKKVMSAAKRIKTNRARRPGDRLLRDVVSETLQTIRDVVGCTLGPGGRPVLIERYETDLPPTVTKDGVTAFRALGFEDSIAHAVMEMTRDAAGRTAAEAGDGTTTATILSEAIHRYMRGYCEANPSVSPQRVVKRIEGAMKKLDPLIRGWAVGTRPYMSDPNAEREAGPRIDSTKEEGRALLHAVAKVSANGDVPLADAVIQAFDICGDLGNVTLVEEGGPSGYAVDEIKGYPIFTGYEDSAGAHATQFLNDRVMMRCVLKAPLFVLYHGAINDTSTLAHLLSMIGTAWEKKICGENVVVVATHFSDLVLATLGFNFEMNDTMNVVPLVAPRGIVPNSQLNFLEDLAAVTGAEVYDPISRPLRFATLEGLGAVQDDKGVWSARVTEAEIGRGRSYVYGDGDTDGRAFRCEMLEHGVTQAASQLDAMLMRERIAALSGGIAKIRVIGPSNGETKEARDRAEDAVCAVRGAIKHGALYGGGWTLLQCAKTIDSWEDPILAAVLVPALLDPLRQLLTNVGMSDKEIEETIDRLGAKRKPEIYDALEGKFVHPATAEIYDSVPAVLEALRNSLSIASRAGTLGAVICFARDGALERDEAREAAAINGATDGTREFVNEANERP